VRQNFANNATPLAPRKSGAGGIAQAAAFLLPFIGAISQTRGDALFRSDAAILNALSTPSGLSGALSARLGEIFTALPLGDLAFRLALVGAFFCGLGGLAALHLSYFLFRRQGGVSRLDPWLALGASLAVALSLPWLEEATIAGGATVGGGLALVLSSVLFIGGVPRTVAGAGLFGVLVGALLAESPWCGVVLLLALVVAWPEAAQLRYPDTLRALASRASIKNPGRHFFKVVALLGCAGVVWVILVLPQVVSTTLSLSSLETIAPAESSDWPVHSPLSWISSVGFVWCAGALVGAIFGLPERRPIYAFLSLIAIDLLAPGAPGKGWTEALSVDESRRSLHLLALGVVGPLGALGLRTLGETAHALRLFAARPLATMMAVIAFAGCFASAEDSLRTLSRSGTSAAQTWTDEALAELPEGSLVLTSSRSWGARLAAAQILGQRPDVLVVPLDKVTTGQGVEHWLQKEPALEHLLRDFSVADTPSESAITRLIDERPVFAEPDPSWDPRLLEHLEPTAPLARASSHALARSDRVVSLDALPARRSRILSACDEAISVDSATLALFEKGLDRLSACLEIVRDTAAVDRLAKIRGKVDDEHDGPPSLGSTFALKP
jgi:hypothetical protein